MGTSLWFNSFLTFIQISSLPCNLLSLFNKEIVLQIVHTTFMQIMLVHVEGAHTFPEAPSFREDRKQNFCSHFNIFFLPNIIFFFYLLFAFIKHLNHNIFVVGEEKMENGSSYCNFGLGCSPSHNFNAHPPVNSCLFLWIYNFFIIQIYNRLTHNISGNYLMV